MDVDQDAGRTEDGESLSGIESKKHRMHTGQDSEGFARRYQLLEQLGSGASGTVWKCRLAPGQAGGSAGSRDEPAPGVIYAAKIIDLRPFKLRERFSMRRLMREVEIMRRLRHPNIIGLVEALDTPEQLVLVLEYAPGVELFDAILSKSCFSEDEARPVFVQVARALQYMHSKQIVHRDVKPENVMIIDRTTTEGLYPEAKLLDFGLSKVIDPAGGSAARTFVGTPSYLAPEVEEKQGGKGKPYGTAVDCWSLGAMLYVMLVARFPEFQVQGKRKLIRMQGALWDKVSTSAKELIRHLMAFDAGARLTVEQALRHPWLKELAVKETRPPPLQQPVPSGMAVEGMAPLPETMAFTVPPGVMSSDTYESPPAQGSRPWEGGDRPPIVTEQETPPATSEKKRFNFTPDGPSIRELQSDESPLSSLDSGMGEAVHPAKDTRNNTRSNQIRREESNSAGIPNTGTGHQERSSEGDNSRALVSMYGASEIGLAGPPDGGVPLLQLQNRISACLETAVTTYTESPQAAASLRKSATLCRESLRDSVTLLRKIERTAAQVITLFPDLTLAVEEGEPELAHDFFSTVKSWVREMYTAVSLVQARNSENADKVGEAMTEHALMGHERMKERARQEEQQRQQQEEQQQQREEEKAKRSSYVANRNSSKGLTGILETDAGRQGDLIAVDAETFEVVRQLQAMRQGSNGAGKASENRTASGDGVDRGSAVSTTSVHTAATAPNSRRPSSSSAGSPAAAAAAAAAASGGDRGGGDASASVAAPAAARDEATTNLVDSISDEKLINLFLLMAKGFHRTPGHKEQEARSGDLAGGAPVTSPGEDSMAGVEAMFAPPGQSPVNGGSTTAVWQHSSGSAMPTPAASPASPAPLDGNGLAANIAAQMSIDESMGRPVPASGSGVSVPIVSNASGGSRGSVDFRSSGGQQQQQQQEHGHEQGDADRWSGMQLARRDDDKIFAEVQRALQMLHEVDSVLEQLALFWANSEVIFDVLLRKGDLVEKFVAFANKPRLLQRFRERLADYKRFWECVQGVCNKYVCGQVNCPPCNGNSNDERADRQGHGPSSPYEPHVEEPAFSPTRNHSASSSGSGAEAADTAGREGLGGAGSWADVRMGLNPQRGP